MKLSVMRWRGGGVGMEARGARGAVSSAPECVRWLGLSRDLGACPIWRRELANRRHVNTLFMVAGRCRDGCTDPHTPEQTALTSLGNMVLIYSPSLHFCPIQTYRRHNHQTAVPTRPRLRADRPLLTPTTAGNIQYAHRHLRRTRLESPKNQANGQANWDPFAIPSQNTSISLRYSTREPPPATMSSSSLAPLGQARSIMTPVKQTPPPVRESPGNWKHPRLAEITRRQSKTSFNEKNIMQIVYNVVAFAGVALLRKVLLPFWPKLV